MEEISKFLDLLEEGKGKGKPSRDLVHHLRPDSIRPGLQRFLGILDSGIKSSDVGRLGFESLSLSQIDAVVSVAKLLLSFTVTATELAVVAILENSMNFCRTLREKLEFVGLDFSLQDMDFSLFD